MAESDEVELFALTKAERQLLIRLVWRALDDDRYPMAPRLDPLKAIPAKLEPPPPPPQPLRPLPPQEEAPSHERSRRRR